MQWTFLKFNITLFLFFDFNAIYFLTNRTCARNGLHDFSITLYILFYFLQVIMADCSNQARKIHQNLRRIEILCSTLHIKPLSLLLSETEELKWTKSYCLTYQTLKIIVTWQLKHRDVDHCLLGCDIMWPCR
jgi:hypothetical protein